MDKPKTLSDWIMLMQAVKEKYGDLSVKIRDANYDTGYFDSLHDVVVECGSSLLRKESVDNESAFVILYE